jgi:alkanesulfonate monooxygenase SsuD/methylene tetrahydromethanopterin reductase-like flavin-dependent oxidoreductase (luciferase family)
MPNTADASPADGPILECWAALAALAAAVPRLRLGTLVSPITFHHPALLAKRAATIDRISCGRFVLGLGAGWQVNEHRAYGVKLPPPKARVDRFEEAIQIVHSLLRVTRTTFVGQHFEVTDAPCEPKPAQDPLPLLVGSAGPRMQRLTARYADEWNTWGTPEALRPKLESLAEACAREARDPATLRRSAQALFFVDDGTLDEAAVAEIRGRVPPDRVLIGTTTALAEHVAAYSDLGIDELIVSDLSLGRTPDERLDRYEQLRTEVFGTVS